VLFNSPRTLVYKINGNPDVKVMKEPSITPGTAYVKFSGLPSHEETE
jgi:hypothetical protein